MSQIAHADGVVRNLHAVQVIECQGCCIEVAGAADTTNAWCDDQSVEDAAALHHLFEAAEHGAGYLSFDDLVVEEIYTDFQITLNPVDRHG